jgi:hypothetical protein
MPAAAALLAALALGAPAPIDPPCTTLPPWRFSWSTSDAGDESGPLLASASSTLDGVTARVPRSVRGTAVGRLRLVEDGTPRNLTLRAPRAAAAEAVLLRRDGLRVTLRLGRHPRLLVTGLPPRARAAGVRLLGPGRDLLRQRACHLRSSDVLRTRDGQMVRLLSGSSSCARG